MLDVHPPHHAASTWRDFFIHIATIVVGLLIAVGLEQLVEALHHRHQRAELREALERDNEKALRDVEDVERQQLARVRWLDARMANVTLALHTPAHARYLAFVDPGIKSVPVDPNWKSARSSDLASVLTQQDITAYAEVSDLTEALNTLYQAKQASIRLEAFEARFRLPFSPAAADLSTATRQDLLEEISLLSEDRSNAFDTYSMALYLHGGLASVLRGERNLDRIDDDENQAYDMGIKLVR